MTIALQLACRLGGFGLSVNLRLPATGVTVIWGASGAGKTTLLNAVAGFQPATGLIQGPHFTWLNSAQGIDVPTHRRRLGMVFQSDNLWRHCSVRATLDYALKRAPQPLAASERHAILDLLKLHSCLDRKPAALSLGEQQRAALARALWINPQALLLDEPFSALDPALRLELLNHLDLLKQRLMIPVLLVTHRVDEMVRLADHVVVLDQGQVQANLPIEAALLDPALARRLGDDAGVVMWGRLAQRDDDHLVRIDCPIGPVWVRDLGTPLGERVRLRLLAKDVSVSRMEPIDSSVQNRQTGIIEAIDDDHHPAQVLVRIRLQQTAVLARITHRALRHLALSPQQAVWVQFKSVAVLV